MFYDGYDLRIKAYELKDGIKMPPMNLGLYRLNNYNILYKIMEFALNEGDRIIADSGPIYFDRYQMDRFIRGQIPIPMIGQRDPGRIYHENTIVVNWRCVSRFFRIACLFKPGLVHIDVYLIHFRDFVLRREYEQPRLQNFLAVAKIRDVSKLIGITHFTMHHLRDLADVMAFGLMTERDDEIEYHPHHVDTMMLKYCIYNNILYHTARFFRVMTIKNTELLLDPIAKKIANKYGSSPTEVLLAWALQHGLAVISKTTKISRMRKNILLNIKLSSKEMKALDALGVYNKNNCWDPTTVA